MKVAYLFIEKYPNYDLTFKTLDCIDSDDLVDLETYISVGLMSMNWLFSMLVLRLVLLINDLLTTFPGKQKIIYDESHFEFI